VNVSLCSAGLQALISRLWACAIRKFNQQLRDLDSLVSF
jgi:hypothetical protein